MRWKNITMFLWGIVIATLLIAVVLFLSPLRDNVVHSSTAEMRRELVRARFQADSLLSVNARINSYLQDKRMQIHSYGSKDCPSDTSSIFHSKSGLYSEVSLLYTPVKGIVKEPFNPSSGQLGTKILCAQNAAVMALMKGIVISVGYTEENKWEVIVQHNDGFLSVYRHLSVILCQPGDFFKEGNVIGRMEALDSDKLQPIIEIELWRNGVPHDIQEYVSF